MICYPADNHSHASGTAWTSSWNLELWHQTLIKNTLLPDTAVPSLAMIPHLSMSILAVLGNTSVDIRTTYPHITFVLLFNGRILVHFDWQGIWICETSNGNAPYWGLGHQSGHLWKRPSRASARTTKTQKSPCVLYYSPWQSHDFTKSSLKPVQSSSGNRQSKAGVTLSLLELQLELTFDLKWD